MTKHKLGTSKEISAVEKKKQQTQINQSNKQL